MTAHRAAARVSDVTDPASSGIRTFAAYMAEDGQSGAQRGT